MQQALHSPEKQTRQKNNKKPTERPLHQQHHNNVVSRVQFCELRVSPASNDAL